jgi:mono/diheme cytochrome c family protein
MYHRAMNRFLVGSVGLALGLFAAIATAQDSTEPAAKRGWTIPPGAAQEANPVAASPEVLAKGKKLYEDNCQKCHGKGGKGDGPDADPDNMPEDLSDPARAVRNPDGVMFYKIWNGRKSPKMPGVKTEGFSKDDVWTVIHFAKTFRPKA